MRLRMYRIVKEALLSNNTNDAENQRHGIPIIDPYPTFGIPEERKSPNPSSIKY